MKQVVVDESVCLLDVLDTAGQEEYAAMREQYMQTCEGILLVYSITSRESFDDWRTFYNQILRVRENIVAHDGELFPLCIVGNKADLDYERHVSTAEGYALAKEFCCNFIETSAKSRVNVEQCFYDLVRLVRTRRTLNIKENSTGSPSKFQLTIDLDWLLRRQKPGVSSRNLPIQEYIGLTHQLVQAAKINNERTVKKLLMKGADPDGHSGPYGSAIYAAAAAGHSNIVVLLLSRGAAVSARGPRGVTPLQVAAVEGHHEIVQLLLSKGVPVDERSRLVSPHRPRGCILHSQTSYSICRASKNVVSDSANLISFIRGHGVLNYCTESLYIGYHC